MNPVAVVLIILAVVFVAVFVSETVKVSRMAPEQRSEYLAAQRAKREQRKITKTGRPAISQVGRTDAGTLACPNCGGAQFKARRTGKARAGIVATGVIGAAATRQRIVQCVTCGAKYARG